MRRTISLVFLAVSSAFSWQQAPKPSPVATDLVEMKPDNVIATINGRKFTFGEFEKLTQILSPQMKALAAKDPGQFLKQIAISEMLLKEAEKLKVDQMTPWRDQLEMVRRDVLSKAVITHKSEVTKVAPEDVRKYYDGNLEWFREARVRVIFVSRASFEQRLADGKVLGAKSVEEMKARAEKVLKLAREGQNFVDLAKEYSDDRDSAEQNEAMLATPIRANDDGIPKNMRDAVLKAEVGRIVGLLEHETGWYVFKVESNAVPSFAEAKGPVEKRLRDAAVQRWVDEMQTRASVTIDNQGFWDTFVAANKQAQDKQAEQQKQGAPAK